MTMARWPTVYTNSKGEFVMARKKRASKAGLKANGRLKKGYKFRKGGKVVKARKR